MSVDETHQVTENMYYNLIFCFLFQQKHRWYLT